MRSALLSLVLSGLIASCGTDGSEGRDGLWSTSVGTGPPTVIVVHGGPGVTHRYLRPEWDRLTDLARVVYYDQRGCGWSERTDSVTWHRHVDDLESLVEDARVEGAVYLAGSSWGSILAVLHSYVHPGRVEGLILSGVPGIRHPPFFPRNTRWKEPTVQILDDGDSLVSYGDSVVRYSGDSVVVTALINKLTAVSRPLDSSQTVLDSAEVAADTMFHSVIAERVGMACPGVAAEAWRSLQATGPSIDDLATIGAPVLIIRGTDESRVGDGAADLARVLAGATVASLDDTGHDPWLDKPDEFFELARGFLSEQQNH